MYCIQPLDEAKFARFLGMQKLFNNLTTSPLQGYHAIKKSNHLPFYIEGVPYDRIPQPPTKLCFMTAVYPMGCK